MKGIKVELIFYLGETIEFSIAYERFEIGTFFGDKIKVISLPDLIKLKSALNRPKDLFDVEELKNLHKRRK